MAKWTVSMRRESLEACAGGLKYWYVALADKPAILQTMSVYMTRINQTMSSAAYVKSLGPQAGVVAFG